MVKFQPRLSPSTAMIWLSPLIAIALTLLISSLVFSLMSVSPLDAFRVFILMPLSDGYNLGELLVKATPLLLCAVGLSLCFRANVWNIGAEGQLLIGALVGGAVALLADEQSSMLAMLMTLGAGISAGMLWAAIPTLLHQWFHTNIILTSIMLNYIALYLLLWAVHGPLADPDGFGFPESALFADSVLLPTLSDSGRATISTLVALLAAVIAAFVLHKTLPGFKLRVFGAEPAAARYAGFSGNKVIWAVMLSAGALAGFAGVAETTGPIGQLVPQISPGYGYAAIIVAYLGRLNPIAVVVSALFMGVLYLGSDLAQIELGIPVAIAGLFQGTLLFFLLGCDCLIRYRLVVTWPGKSRTSAQQRTEEFV